MRAYHQAHLHGRKRLVSRKPRHDDDPAFRKARASQGGKARWANITPKERKKAMRYLAKKMWAKLRENLKQQQQDDHI